MTANWSEFSDKKVSGTQFDNPIRSIAARPIFSTVLLGLRDGQLIEIYPDSGELANHYGRIHSEQIRQIIMNEDQTQIWTCADDGSLRKVR